MKQSRVETHRARWLADFLQDLRHGARLLRGSPGFTAAALLTLALGMGANTAILTLINTFALRPLPVPDPESIVHVGEEADGRRRLFSYLEYLDYRDGNRTFAGMIALNGVAAVLGDALPGAASADGSLLASGYQYAFGWLVSGNYFELLGAHMLLGRPFSPDEDRSPGKHPVIVISYSFWERHLDADPAVIGKPLKLNGTTFTIIGVTAADFIGTEPVTAHFWAPIMMRDALVKSWLLHSWHADRNARCFNLLGRLRPAISRQSAEADLRLIEKQLDRTYPSPGREVNPVRVTSHSTFFNLSSFMPLVTPVLLAVGLVLLVACANVANLLVSRAAARQREICVRLSLGSSRARLVRQLLTESVLLALLGGASALVLSIWTIRTLYPVILSSLPLPSGFAETLMFDMRPDARVFGLTVLLSVLTGIVFGLAPALETSQVDLTPGLKADGALQGRRPGRAGLRSGLIVVQVAVCIVLLTAASLLVRNVRKLEHLDTGLATKNVFAASAGRPGEKDGYRETQLRQDLILRLRAMPGIDSLGEARRVPLSGSFPSAQVTFSGHGGIRTSSAGYNLVSPGYFQTVGPRLARGRLFTGEESDSAAPVAVISETTAKRFWPDEEAIGKRITIGSPAAPGQSDRVFLPDREVIGIVRDARNQMVWRKDGEFVYLPQTALGPDTAYVLVRLAAGETAVSFQDKIRREAQRIDSNAEVSVRAVEESLDIQMVPFRACATLAGSLGLLALLMASIGLYGVISYLVGQRTREFGIRLALGSTRQGLLRLVLRSGMRLVLAGSVAGIAGAALVSRLVGAVLIDFSTLDPLSYAVAATVVAGVALTACAVPAWRAADVDPIVALRHE